MATTYSQGTVQYINVSDRYRAHDIHKKVIYVSGDGNNKDINSCTKIYSHTGKQRHCKPMHMDIQNHSMHAHTHTHTQCTDTIKLGYTPSNVRVATVYRYTDIEALVLYYLCQMCYKHPSSRLNYSLNRFLRIPVF
jgi:hypothetical protein